MSMKLSNEKKHLVLENQGLVYYIVQKLIVAQSEYEDIVSIGTIGLIKAAITFNESKKIAFATYASRCIYNEIFMYYRKAKKYENDISIDKPIGRDEEGKEFTLRNTIEHPESDFVKKIVNEDAFVKLVSIILNYLNKKEKLVILYRIGDVSQKDIAKKINISQGYVSRIEKKAIKKIRKVANYQVDYKEVFSMAIVKDEYRISFSSKDIRNFNEIFASFLQNLTSTESLPDFTINCNKERIVVKVPAHPESFSFIAQIIQEIDDFSISFVSNKSTLPKEDAVSQNVELITKDTASTSEKLDTVTKSKVEGVSKCKQVRDYMLSMSSFSVKDLKQHFPNLTTNTINNAVYLAKCKGLITATARGEYTVNKT